MKKEGAPSDGGEKEGEGEIEVKWKYICTLETDRNCSVKHTISLFFENAESGGGKEGGLSVCKVEMEWGGRNCGPFLGGIDEESLPFVAFSKFWAKQCHKHKGERKMVDKNMDPLGTVFACAKVLLV